MASETQRLEDMVPEDSEDYSENILPKGAILQSRYEILRVLGIGGMGAVYLAQDLRFTGVKRLCAIKEMVSTTPDPQVRRMAVQSFEREANLLVQLSHSGIPKIYDFFTESIRTYLVMEYVDGEDLETILENTEGMLKEDTILEWAIEVCEVLVYLHSQDPPVVFRDFKPSNIMLRKQGEITLIDFGIAKAFQAGQKGTMIGTEGYSPPEQYKGITDPRGDIYALGATLHHLLTKRDPRLEPPFTFHEEPPQLLNPALSPQTNEVVMRALEYEMEKRFQSAKEFKKALVGCLNRDKSATDSGTATRALPGSSMLQQQPPPPATGRQQQQQQPAYSPQQPYPPPQYPYPPPQQGGYPHPAQYYPQQHPMTTASLMGEEAEEEGDSILPIWKFKCEDEVRASPVLNENKVYIGAYDNNVYALDRKSGEFQWKYATEGGIATKPFVYKDRLIFGSEDRVAYAINTGGRLVWTCPTEDRIRSSAVVEFDHAFFGSDDHKLYAVNAQTGRVIWKFEAMGPIRSTPTLGEELVYVGSEDGYLYAVDMSSGSTRWKFRANRNITSSPLIYKNELVIVGSADAHVYGVDAKTGYSIWFVRTNQSVISSPTLYEDMIYIGSADKHLYAIDADSGKVRWKYNTESPIVSTPAVTAEAIYFGNMKGEVISITRKDKKLRWKFRTEKPVPSSPVVADGVVYIGSMDHHLYALPA